jgi:hypothetical protein
MLSHCWPEQFSESRIRTLRSRPGCDHSLLPLVPVIEQKFLTKDTKNLLTAAHGPVVTQS